MRTLPAELAADSKLPMARVARALGVSPSAVCRWSLIGLRSPRNGELVRLAAFRVGGRRFVAGAEVNRFLRQLDETSVAAAMSPAKLSHAQAREVRAAMAELGDLGAVDVDSHDEEPRP